MTDTIESRFFTADDGLRLHVLDARPREDRGLTAAVCLPGLTRGAGDFARLAQALAAAENAPRRVVAFDYRGRGRSAHDSDWRHYDLATERGDISKGLDELGIGKAHWIGTSRGGLHIMALAAERRDLIRSAVLNDIGPRLEPQGLARIKGYVGTMLNPASLDEAIKLLKIGAGAHFDGLSADEWRWFATTTFGADAANLAFSYDPQLARTLDAFDLTKPLPESWDLYDALADLPLLVIRGERSDLLSERTFAEMTSRWRGCEGLRVPGQGHAPLLADAHSISAIEAFLRRADATA